MKYILILLTAICLSTPALADHGENVIDLKVNGMVCDFCAQSILKVFEENEGVENIDVYLDNGMVILTLKEEATITDEEIEEKIYYAGYDLVSIERHKT